MNADHVHLFIKNPFCKQKAFTEKCFADPPKYSVSWIAKRLKGRNSKLLRDKFLHLKEWCPDHLWAPSCYHGSVGHGWEVVEKYITGQKNYYRKEDAIPVVVVDEEKERTYKIGFITLHTKIFAVTGPVP